ncbi:restriction alleviation protein Lar [Paraburkholderia sp. BL6669N2]|uniref:Lar family restriction alleviation protein n=1 Tax=Paraburkholderia sp. BL6669N2 TaxID=1938807 RepID=UPI000E248B65|nr:Lar family restriction alleviation protein [Paraburkholderia sp. BL6669N2]REG45428.1 restriction alleviation protein Lar [Paraburkholderia sp. BL6669N2]
MYEQLYPCDHCGGRGTVGFSQRVVAEIGQPGFDYGKFGREAGPPKIGDVTPRPPFAPQTEKLACVHCADCGMSTPWIPIGSDEAAALNEAARIWNRRLARPKVTEGDLRDLIEKELGACDMQMVIDMLARNADDWETRGPIFSALAQRLVDASVSTIESWPIDPVLQDAARYRKLVQLAKWVDIDGQRYVQFPKIPTPPEHDDCLFEDRIALAVDGMPDRDRW